MGYNKVILCLNDAEHTVTDNPTGWWEACRNAFYRLSRKDLDKKTYVKQPETFGFNGCANHWQAVWEAHADQNAVIIVGQNYATVVGATFGMNGHHEEEVQIKILKDILENKGYTIRKKPQKKA